MAERLGKVLAGQFPAEPPGGFQSCPECGEKWWRLTGLGVCHDCHTAAQEAEREARRRPLDRNTALERAGVPPRLRRVEFREPKQWPEHSTGMRLAAWSGEPELLTLSGPTDTGKSTLAAELLWRQGGGRWVVAADVAGVAIREPERYRELATASTLVVDELGRRHDKGAWEYVHALVAERWDWLRPTIVTTNASLAWLSQDAQHPALARRLRDGWWVQLERNWRER